jgi:hypothetical protein
VNKKARQLNRQKIKASRQGLTRARAERLISRQWDTLTDEQMQALRAHKNSHVLAKLKAKGVKPVAEGEAKRQG